MKVIIFFIGLSAIRCDPIDLPEHVNINPPLCAGPGDVSARTRCTPYCPIGRDLQGDGSPIVCGIDGQWNSSSEDLACLGELQKRHWDIKVFKKTSLMAFPIFSIVSSFLSLTLSFCKWCILQCHLFM